MNESNTYIDQTVKEGTLCGTLLSVIAQVIEQPPLNFNDILRTAALAAVGAVVGFLCSWGMKEMKLMVTRWTKRP